MMRSANGYETRNTDPFSSMTRPPPGETSAERDVRIIDQVEARRISDQIDEQIRIEREQIRKRVTTRQEVKVLLLGQAESGKSTLQKQFQLAWSTMDQERPSWRPVVYFNVINAVRIILDELEFEFAHEQHEPSSPWVDPHSGWQGQLSTLRTRLWPLVSSEQSLATELRGSVAVSGNKPGVFVKSGWLALTGSEARRPQNERRGMYNGPDPHDLVTRLLAASQADIEELWLHASVRTLLRTRKLKLEDSAAFFLDSVSRIASPDYIPSVDDILRVRLQTLGVVEHSFNINLGGRAVNWMLYDVGGARGQRHSWAPYFDDANAIIFLAPISAYDQYLEEDYRTNRIDDSLQLFTTICSNKLLRSCHLILLLNKTDVLRTKLAAGIKVKKYITSYGNRPNEYEEVAEYFRAHFMQVHRRNDIGKRVLFTHFTSTIDTKSTQKIISNVRDSILHDAMTQSHLV
ncbi:G-alpha-domain-containing protein [Sistotremastrum niveocremeum HHB9708]|uniref:G-alpha-domain-containing protein n=1 Tax=Sistotremastrum niveocremeum HHB9708 TaxID=1314777 RepID=A0A165A0H6_9AGAM|nr:G-alpha-domain-containing protein [Sistotremastrum niveocremeum HHB9708]